MKERFDAWAESITQWVGSAPMSLAALTFVIGWTAGGFVTGFTDTYQLIINTSTTIITFLMVFVIQHAANRNDRAMHRKLDELIVAVKGARNEVAGIEHAPTATMDALPPATDPPPNPPGNVA